MHAESSGPGDDAIKELLVDQLRDILHAEKQLTKALPKMAKSARSAQLQRLFETHLQETEAQAERLNECLRLLGSAARPKPCKGMAGLVEEGEEVMHDTKTRTMPPPTSPSSGQLSGLSTMKWRLTRRPETWPCKCVSLRSSSFSQRHWAKNKMRGNCSIRSRSPSCRSRGCQQPSNKAAMEINGGRVTGTPPFDYTASLLRLPAS